MTDTPDGMQLKDLADSQDRMMQEKHSLRDCLTVMPTYAEEQDDLWKDLEVLVQARIKLKDLWKEMVQETLMVMEFLILKMMNQERLTTIQ